MSKAEVKSALEQIDAAPTAQQKAEVRTHYDVLNQRRTELQKEFTRARYDAFKADLQAEVDKVSASAEQHHEVGNPTSF